MFVFAHDFKSFLDVESCECIHRIAQHVRHVIAERFEFTIRVRWAIHAGKLRREEADLLGLVADTLEIRNRLDDGDNQAQITCSRRPRRKNATAFLIDADLDLVDLVVVICDLQPQFAVAADDRRYGSRQLRFDEAAHVQHVVPQILNILIEAPRNVVRKFGCLRHYQPPGESTSQWVCHLNLNSTSSCNRL